MEITHPRRILAVSKPDSGLTDLIKALTGSTPSPTNNTIAGATHNWHLTTSYYRVNIPIWLDEIHNPTSWASEFLNPEAREVLAVLGGFIICFHKPVDEDEMKEIKNLLEKVGEVVKEGCGENWDGVCLAVGMPQSRTPCLELGNEEWEDLCREFGFEFVDFEGRGRNQFAEPMGVERLKEALEANDWDGGGVEEELEGDSDGEVGFGLEAAEVEKELQWMKEAIYGSGSGEAELDEKEDADQEDEVEKLQGMILKMQAARDMGQTLPKEQRKKYAAKAVNDIMKTF